MKTKSQLSDENRRRAILTAKNFREAVNNSVTPWSDEEQRIAVELMKQLVGATPSKVLVRKIKHMTDDAIKVAVATGSGRRCDIEHVVELNEYVGLRLYQQRIVELAFQDACAQVPVSINS